MLLYMGELLESPVTVGAFVGLFSRVDADVLGELVIG